MRKVVINTCFGGFGLSNKAEVWIKVRNLTDDIWDLPRDHPLLVECIETLGDEANGRHAELKIVEIPENVEWHIAEYDGREHVAEYHRTRS